MLLSHYQRERSFLLLLDMEQDKTHKLVLVLEVLQLLELIYLLMEVLVLVVQMEEVADLVVALVVMDINLVVEI